MRCNLCPVSGAGLTLGRRSSLIRVHSIPHQCPKAFNRSSCREGWLSQQHHLSTDFWILHVLNTANRNTSLVYTNTFVIFCFLFP